MPSAANAAAIAAPRPEPAPVTTAVPPARALTGPRRRWAPRRATWPRMPRSTPRPVGDLAHDVDVLAHVVAGRVDELVRRPHVGEEPHHVARAARLLRSTCARVGGVDAELVGDLLRLRDQLDVGGEQRVVDELHDERAAEPADREDRDRRTPPTVRARASTSDGAPPSITVSVTGEHVVGATAERRVDHVPVARVGDLPDRRRAAGGVRHEERVVGRGSRRARRRRARPSPTARRSTRTRARPPPHGQRLPASR